MTRLQLRALIGNISLNILKIVWGVPRNVFFYFCWRQAAVSQRLNYVSWQGGWTLFPNNATAMQALDRTLKPPIERRTSHRRQCPDVRWCYDVPLGRCYGTNDRTKRIRLTLTICHDFMQGLFHQIFRGGAIWTSKYQYRISNAC